MRAASLIGLSLLEVLSSTLAAAIPVEGDLSLLQLVRDAQATNQSRFQRGALTAKASQRTVSQLSEYDVTATLIWDGAHTFWDHTFDDESQVTWPDGQVASPAPYHALMLETPAERVEYYTQRADGRGMVLRFPNPPLGAYPAILRLRPDQVWFRQHYTPVPDWRSAFDPEKHADVNTKLVVRRESTDRIVIEIHSTNTPPTMFVVSLAHGGNVVSTHTDANPDPKLRARGIQRVTSHADFEWEQNPSGIWFLRRLVNTWVDPDHDAPFDWRYELDVTEFDPDPVIAADRFTYDSLHVPEGAIVEVYRPRSDGKLMPTRVRSGQEQPGPTQQQLDSLAETVRTVGFGRTQRAETR